MIAGAATQPLAPVQQGLIITSALRTESGDRENVVKIVQVLEAPFLTLSIC